MFSQKTIKLFRDISQLLENCNVITKRKTSAQSPFVFHNDIRVENIFTKSMKESYFQMKINVVSLLTIVG